MKRLSKKRILSWLLLLAPAFLCAPFLWYPSLTQSPSSGRLLVAVFVGSCFGVSLAYNWRDGLRGRDLVVLSLATAMIAVLVNAVLLFGIGFAGCVYSLGKMGKPAP